MRYIPIALLLLSSPALAETTFAEIDASGNVLRVIVADQAFIDSGAVGPPSNWVQTFPDGSARKNYAGPGHIYNRGLDAFIPPKPFPSWHLNPQRGRWEAPFPPPQGHEDDIWDEPTQNYVSRPGTAVVVPNGAGE